MSNVKERRQHVVYITKNTEYHCRRKECVGVRDRTTGRWRRWHAALRGQLLGSIFTDRQTSRRAEVGARLCFAGDRSVVTSQVLGVARPPKTVLWSYASLCWAGRIEA